MTTDTTTETTAETEAAAAQPKVAPAKTKKRRALTFKALADAVFGSTPDGGHESAYGLTVPINWIRYPMQGMAAQQEGERPNGFSYDVPSFRNGMKMHIIETYAPHDGHEWHHVSMSIKSNDGTRHAMPNYDDMVYVKQHLMGDETWAYQVFAPKADHVNIHNWTLHLWRCVDGPNPLPEFARFGSI